MKNKIPTLALVLVAIGLGSLLIGIAYSAYFVRPLYSGWNLPEQNQRGMMQRWQSQPPVKTNAAITLDQAKQIAQQYLASIRNPNLAVREIMEFQNNFYVVYYEKSTGIGAFEMLIWKQTRGSGMMGGGMMESGVIVPEPGPNMMWNTKYNTMGSSMMGQGMMGSQNRSSSTMTVSEDKARQIAQTYLDGRLKGAEVEGVMQFYGYYTIDFEVNSKIAGMLSVNGYTGQVWGHSWHGDFIQEIEMD